VPAALLANAGLEPRYAGIAAPPAGVAPTNLAAGKPVVAQFLDGGTAQLQPESQLKYATDGDPATVQASGQFRWQLVVDLQQAMTQGYVTVRMPQPHFATDFHVDASTDGTTWTTVGTVHGSGWGSIPVEFTTPLTARYLRVVADKPDHWGQRRDQMAISEIGAYAPTKGGNNTALKRPAQARSSTEPRPTCNRTPCRRSATTATRPLSLKRIYVLVFIEHSAAGPRANAICERVVGTLRREVFDQMLIFNEKHLSKILVEYAEHYNRHRPTSLETNDRRWGR
jgi:hypothetical protein